MRWITSPDWSDETAHRLHHLLRKAIHDPNEIKRLYQEIGLDPSRQYWNDPASVLWPAVTRDAADACRLPILIWKVRDRRPALAAEFDAILNAKSLDESWYHCADPFKSKLVGPGSTMAVLDREGLRTGLIAIARQGYSILAICGAAGSGRSYSKRVLRHVTEHPRKEWELTIVDAEHLTDPAHALDLFRMLAYKLALPESFGADEWTEYTSRAREIVTRFVGSFRHHLPREKRWIFLDSLDRERVQPDLHAAVGHLASEIEDGQLFDTRLIVTGHPGDFAPDVLEVLRQEEIAQITEQQVRAFFTQVAQDIGRTLETAELAGMVASVQARAGAGGLRELGRAVSEVAHHHFGAAEGAE